LADRNEIKDVVEALYQLKISVKSLNPDPAQAIAEHRRQAKGTRYLAVYSAVIATVTALSLALNFVFTRLGPPG
jgi:hypothetical protein